MISYQSLLLSTIVLNDISGKFTPTSLLKTVNVTIKILMVLLESINQCECSIKDVREKEDLHQLPPPLILVYVILWVAVVFGINCMSNEGWKLVIVRSAEACYSILISSF